MRPDGKCNKQCQNLVAMHPLQLICHFNIKINFETLGRDRNHLKRNYCPQMHLSFMEMKKEVLILANV